MTSSGDLTTRLAEAAKHAKAIPFLEVMLPTGSPQENKCHENVEVWVQNHPEYSIVRGWLIVSSTIAKHSVTAAPDGVLFDITPLRYRYKFFSHPGSEQEYQVLLSGGLSPLVQWGCEVQ